MQRPSKFRKTMNHHSEENNDAQPMQVVVDDNGRSSNDNSDDDDDNDLMGDLLQDVEELGGPKEVLADYELDCYPYTFTPLLLFSPSSYFDKVRIIDYYYVIDCC
jgi:hypothetical protein